MITLLNTFIFAFLLLYCQSTTERANPVNNVNSYDAPTWSWAKKVGVTYRITPASYAEMITDTKGNSYLTSYIPADNREDVLLVKYDVEGNELWRRTAGGFSWDAGQAIAFDQEGNIWIIGFFYQKAKFGSFTLRGDKDFNMFLAKYDTSGKCLAAYKPAINNDGFNYLYSPIGAGYGSGFSMAISNKNEIFISNIIQGSISFGEIKVKSNPENDYYSTVLIAKLDTSGKCIWAIKTESSTPCQHGVAYFSPEGNTYITSSCSKTLSVGDKEFTNEGAYDSRILLAKVDENGHCNWIKQIATRVDSEAQQEAIEKKPSTKFDDTEAFYIRVGGNWQFGQMPFETDNGNTFVKLNSKGECLQLIPIGDKSIWTFTWDAQDNVYVAGDWSGTSTYVAKYKSKGELDWIKNIPRDGLLWPRSIQIRNNMLFLTGNYRLRATFDKTVLENHDVHEIFIARLDL
ncbi:hypothetical protein JYU16_01455 [bacterium AH-315-M05]|nr:hypothetical protein [bacterium AH-315-M05]